MSGLAGRGVERYAAARRPGRVARFWSDARRGPCCARHALQVALALGLAERQRGHTPDRPDVSARTAGTPAPSTLHRPHRRPLTPRSQIAVNVVSMSGRAANNCTSSVRKWEISTF
eukprot:2156253-Prymnesium_polylepis.1